jgi:hypothetical protein
MAVYGPVRHPKNSIWTEASEVHIIFFWWRTVPYTAIWPLVPWTICYLCVVALFKYIHGVASAIKKKMKKKYVNLCTICTRDQTFTVAWYKVAKFTLALEMHINWCKFIRVGKKTGRFVYHFVYVITVINWLQCD